MGSHSPVDGEWGNGRKVRAVLGVGVAVWRPRDSLGKGDLDGSSLAIP
jgi:hypothetical protein